ncbi:MAG: hypothetical protein VZR00_04365 [Lachnospiraceae bacterium]|jgi:hypothetical protein|nr:hypothetical protein [Lachnospiraceae bacterium]
MQIKCDKCGAVAETIMPETASDDDNVLRRASGREVRQPGRLAP